MDIKKLLDDAHTEMKSLVERQSSEIKNIGEVSADTAKQLKSAEARLVEVSKEVDERLVEIEKKSGRLSAGMNELKSAGEIFVESDEYKNARSRGLNSTGAVEIKDITSAAGSAGAVALTQRVPGIFRDPADRLVHIRDLINVQQTSSGSIEYYVDYSGFDNQAGSQNGELTAKNKSNLVLEQRTESIKTIAHWVPASRQVLEDAPMLQGYINNRLSYGLKLEEDSQLLYGDGTAGTLTGIMNTAGVQDHGDRPATDDYVSHIRKAMTKARLSNYQVDGLIINPADWEKIELLQNDTGDYIWMWYMSTQGQPRMFRVPIIETNAIAQGDFLLGNWAMAATLWDRQQANVRISESHADLFIKNGVAILGEERIGLTVERPSAFVKGSFVEAV